MQLHTASEVIPDNSGLLCRQSRLRAVFATSLFCALIAGIPFVWWRLAAPWPVWGGCALLALFLVPLLVHDLLLRLRSSNWLLWIRPDGLWIRFRSYQDQHAPDDAPATAQIEFSEIARVQPLVESYSTPSGRNNSVRHREQALLIHLNGEQGRELQEALAAERSRMPAERVVLGFIHIAGKASHFPVTMTSPNVVRIAWRGGRGNDVVPRLDRVIDHIARVAGIQFSVGTDPRREEHPRWDKLDDSQLDALIRQLVESGARIEAIRLLVRRKGCTTTEAHKRVEELTRHSERVSQR